MRWLTTVAAFLAAAPAHAIDPDIAAYNLCVTKEAVRLSTGSDAADLIARNAAVLCGQFLAKAFEKSPGLTGKQTTAWENHAVGEATIAVLEARAKNK